MQLSLNPKTTSARILGFAIGLALLLVAAYILIYQYQPFSDFINNFLSNFLSQLASLFAAIFATLIWRMYEKEDAPKRVWGNFAIGLWLWFIGDLCWGYINLMYGEVNIGVPDIFWIPSYLFFGQALFFQNKILTQPTPRQLLRWIFTVVLALIALIAFIFFLLTAHQTSMNILDTLVNAFYPAVDVLLSIIALWLARNFAGGAFAHPWLGLLAFTISDLLYAWLDLSGTYAWSLEQGNLLSTITDVAYFAAYLVLGLGVLSQWLFLKYGLRTSLEKNKLANVLK